VKSVAAFTGFYDAIVLYPAELRNLLMHLALIGLFRVQSGRRTFMRSGFPVCLKAGLPSRVTSWNAPEC
jgi:hypothetical protein